jgi:hypothetical protein
MGKDFPTDSALFLDSFFPLIALDNLQAAKAVVEPAPSRGSPQEALGHSGAAAGGPSDPSQNNGQLNQEISFHGAICIVASSVRSLFGASQSPPDGRGSFWARNMEKRIADQLPSDVESGLTTSKNIARE